MLPLACCLLVACWLLVAKLGRSTLDTKKGYKTKTGSTSSVKVLLNLPLALAVCCGVRRLLVLLGSHADSIPAMTRRRLAGGGGGGCCRTCNLHVHARHTPQDATQHNTTQHNTTQHSTAQHNTTPRDMLPTVWIAEKLGRGLTPRNFSAVLCSGCSISCHLYRFHPKFLPSDNGIVFARHNMRAEIIPTTGPAKGLCGTNRVYLGG